MSRFSIPFIRLCPTLAGILAAASTPLLDASVLPPAPYGAVPTARQLQWHRREAYAFVHFTVNTFTNREWGLGDEQPAVFNPTDFDADQIVRTAKLAGLRGLILTAKHHDGFCLWPSRLTTHSVKSSPYKEGRGDIVRQFSEACQRYGIGFGVYLSPWDRNHADYGRPEYISYFRGQLRELLTEYGPLFEVWFDGANGGDGYYGGANEMRKIDKATYYDWADTFKLVRELQPNAVIFSDGGPDVRWVGNEKGFAGDPCWATISAAGFLPGKADIPLLNVGSRDGAQWMPAEVDVSIRPGWFYHAKEDAAVKSADQLMKIYFESVGRGTSLNLNLPPDQRGQLPDGDVRVLTEWGRRLRETFARNLADTAAVTASNTRGNSPTYAPINVTSGDHELYWATDDMLHAAELEIVFPQSTRFDVVRLREFPPLGQRIDEFAIEVWTGRDWKELYRGESIGSQRLVKVDPVETTKLRIKIIRARAAVVLQEVGVFLMAPGA